MEFRIAEDPGKVLGKYCIGERKKKIPLEYSF